MKKTDLLHTTVDHYDIKTVNVVPMVDMMEKTAFQARNLARAAKIVDEMVADKDCGIILTLAGSLISAGLKRHHRRHDALQHGGRHRLHRRQHRRPGFLRGPRLPPLVPRTAQERQSTTSCASAHIDRIYDTYINEDELRVCDETIAKDR